MVFDGTITIWSQEILIIEARIHIIHIYTTRMTEKTLPSFFHENYISQKKHNHPSTSTHTSKIAD